MEAHWDIQDQSGQDSGQPYLSVVSLFVAGQLDRWPFKGLFQFCDLVGCEFQWLLNSTLEIDEGREITLTGSDVSACTCFVEVPV